MPVSRRRLLVLGGALAALPAHGWPQAVPRARRIGIVSWSGSLMDHASTGGRDFLAGMKALVVDLAAARKRGITLPQSLLLRADRVIQ